MPGRQKEKGLMLDLASPGRKIIGRSKVP